MSFLPSLNFGSRSSKTFKPKKNIPEGSHQHDLMKHAAATLGSGNLRLAVMLPEGNITVPIESNLYFNMISWLKDNDVHYQRINSLPLQEKILMNGLQ